MAGAAPDAFVDVNAVIEISKVRQIVDPGPTDGFVSSKTVADRLQRRTCRPDLRMAIHAGFCGWNIRESRIFHRRVTITAIDAHGSDVVLVTEWHRLFAGNACLGHVP